MSSQNVVKTICHMLVTLDGKTTGSEMFGADGIEYFIDQYYTLDKAHLLPRSPICFCGRKSVSSLVDVVDPSTYPAAAPGSIPRTDYWADLTPASRPPAGTRFLAVVDTHGRVGWSSNTIAANEFHFYDGDRIIEVLVEDHVTDAYLAHLQKLKIPYIFGGKTELDVRVAVNKLAGYFGVDCVSLHGGSTLNGSFLHRGCVDELSLIQIPFVSGNPAELGLMTAPPGIDKMGSASYTLNGVERLEHNGLWLRYEVKPTSA